MATCTWLDLIFGDEFEDEVACFGLLLPSSSFLPWLNLSFSLLWSLLGGGLDFWLNLVCLAERKIENKKNFCFAFCLLVLAFSFSLFLVAWPKWAWGGGVGLAERDRDRERKIAFNHFSVFGEDYLQSWIKAMIICLGGFAKTICKQVVCCNLAPKFPPKITSFGRPLQA